MKTFLPLCHAALAFLFAFTTYSAVGYTIVGATNVCLSDLSGTIAHFTGNYQIAAGYAAAAILIAMGEFLLRRLFDARRLRTRFAPPGTDMPTHAAQTVRLIQS